MKNRSVPADIVLPHLVYRDLQPACEWLSRVFGFTEHYHYGNPVSGVQMMLGSAFFMLTGERPGTKSPAFIGSNTQTLTVFLEDVDAHYARTKAAGTTIWEELHDTVYGERQYGVEDLDKHRWLFSKHARDVDPAQWGATVVVPIA
jgi:uncharacterized glyoxalase superfamily protein PhnB